MHEQDRARAAFVWTWAALGIVKVMIVAGLPLFVDEAFYWQESRHLAWAYSDLPGLTAWLIRLGTGLGGTQAWAVRLPFLLIGLALPWLLVALARAAGATRPWQAGLLALLLPLTATLGVLALPDLALALASLACLLGGVHLLRGLSGRGALWLGAGLAIGALAHYRFVAVIVAGGAALLLLPQGRQVLRQRMVWVAIGIGALAWLPLLLWNLGHEGAGLRFQFVERHPWAFQPEGFSFVLLQILLATPLLFAAMLQALGQTWQSRAPALRWLALAGGLTLSGFLALGFFADVERVSFHWPLPAWLALSVLLPAVLMRWRRGWQFAAWGMLGLAAALSLVAHLWLSTAAGRAALAGTRLYPENFAGWDEIARASAEALAQMPPGTRILADHFKLGAELGFALQDADILVLDHPLNQRHGRAAQLHDWGLNYQANRDSGHWRLLVVGSSDVKLSALLERFHALCRQLGALPPAQTVHVDGGARRFLLFALPPGRAEGDCITPAIAHVDAPADGAETGLRLRLRGWAVKDVVGIRQVRLHLDGVPLGPARYGSENAFVPVFLRGASRDPALPAVQFEAEVELPRSGPEWRQLELELHGGDGSIERWPGPRLRVRAEN